MAHIVEVLPRPDLVRDVARVHICQWVLLHIPTTKTQIQPAREGDRMVDDDYFLVVRLRGSAQRQRGGTPGTRTQ